jgi:hypothetical protein
MKVFLNIGFFSVVSVVTAENNSQIQNDGVTVKGTVQRKQHRALLFSDEEMNIILIYL